MGLLLQCRRLIMKRSLNFRRQEIENAVQSHCEEMASVTRSAQEKQRELCVLLEQAEAGNQHRGQWFHPPVSLIIVIYCWRCGERQAPVPFRVFPLLVLSGAKVSPNDWTSPTLGRWLAPVTQTTRSFMSDVFFFYFCSSLESD